MKNIIYFRRLHWLLLVLLGIDFLVGQRFQVYDNSRFQEKWLAVSERCGNNSK